VGRIGRHGSGHALLLDDGLPPAGQQPAPGKGPSLAVSLPPKVRYHSKFSMLACIAGAGLTCQQIHLAARRLVTDSFLAATSICSQADQAPAQKG